MLDQTQETGTELTTEIVVTHGETSKIFCSDHNVTFLTVMSLIAEYITHMVPVEDRDNVSRNIKQRKSWDKAVDDNPSAITALAYERIATLTEAGTILLRG